MTNFKTVGIDNPITAYGELSTTVTQNGRLLFSATILGAEFIDLKPYAINIPPTLRLVILAKTVSGTASDANVTLSWYEDV